MIDEFKKEWIAVIAFLMLLLLQFLYFKTTNIHTHTLVGDDALTNLTHIFSRRPHPCGKSAQRAAGWAVHDV